MLYLFVAAYPYGKQENFLEVEIPYLLKEFDKISIVPFGSHNLPARILPKRCDVDNSLKNTRARKVVLGIFNLWRVVPLYVKDFFLEHRYKSIFEVKTWLSQAIMAAYYMQSPIVKKIRHNSKPDDVIYFYWGSGYNSIAPFLKGKIRQVSRFHGEWDLWRNGGKSEGCQPCRADIIKSLDLVAPISNIGLRFLCDRYDVKNIQTFHLGTLDKGLSAKSSDGIVRVLSCSTVYPLKRVGLIYESLKVFAAEGKRVHWTHLGGGPDFEELYKNVQMNKIDNLSIDLSGEIPLSKVYDFYEHNAIDLFINLSTNEGVPVSIMEAISFNIPAIATNVGGNSEVVTPKSGLLVSENPTPQEVSDAILKLIGKNDLTPRLFWDKEFNAEKNYTSFANALYNLSKL